MNVHDRHSIPIAITIVLTWFVTLNLTKRLVSFNFPYCFLFFLV